MPQTSMALHGWYVSQLLRIVVVPEFCFDAGINKRLVRTHPVPRTPHPAPRILLLLHPAPFAPCALRPAQPQPAGSGRYEIIIVDTSGRHKQSVRQPLPPFVPLAACECWAPRSVLGGWDPLALWYWVAGTRWVCGTGWLGPVGFEPRQPVSSQSSSIDGSTAGIATCSDGRLNCSRRWWR